MAQLVWTSTAMDSEIASKKFIKEIISKAEGLASQPFKGRPIPEKIPGGYRQILYKSYRIIYRIEGLNVFISSVYHQKKLLFKL